MAVRSFVCKHQNRIVRNTQYFRGKKFNIYLDVLIMTERFLENSEYYFVIMVRKTIF
jgi:hypothetical protein